MFGIIKKKVVSDVFFVAVPFFGKHICNNVIINGNCS